MFISTRRKKTAGRVYEYLDIVENRRVGGKVQHKILGTLGRRDQLPPHKIDALIGHLRKLASPEGLHGIQLGAMEIVAIREYGVALVAGRLWKELGLDDLLTSIPQTKAVPVSEAVFRMVVNRLCDPQSKLGLVDWIDEQKNSHRGWQREVQWAVEGDIDYHQYLLAMDRLHPHRARIEEALFTRTTNLLSLPLRLCFYDLTSTYFEGDGACELAQYGYSRDHRADRAQVVVGLAVTQEGLPITHRVYPGATVDVSTFVPMTEALRQRFGLQEAVIVADRGMFSADNVADLANLGQRYILALRSRQQTEGELALDLAELARLPRPKAVDAPWEWREVMLIEGLRHVVVYSAFKARHDLEVRARRIRRALPELQQLQSRARRERLSVQRITERVTKILTIHKCARYFAYDIKDGALDFRLDRDAYRQQRRHDGVFVLETNHAQLGTEEIVASYRQLMEVERAFRVLKSLVKLRPIYHHRDRRVETHIFICFLAYLLAKVIEQRLRQAGFTISPAHALEILTQLKAVEHTWEGQARVVNWEGRSILSRNPALRSKPCWTPWASPSATPSSRFVGPPPDGVRAEPDVATKRVQNFKLELGWARHGVAATVLAILMLCVFALADLRVIGLRTLTWSRQTPRHLFFRFGPAKGATLWGVDTGLAFTTYRVTSIVWAAMLLEAFGFLPSWAGVGYALGFTIPLILLVWAVPWRGDLPVGQVGEPGWLTARLIKSQPMARAIGSVSMFAAAIVLLLSVSGVGTLHTIPPW